MAVSFGGDWMNLIADISTREEFQNCTVELVDPDKVEGGELNEDTWEYEPVTDEGVVYTGKARFIPIRAGVPVQGEEQANSTTIRAVRFQIGKDEGPEYIRKGMFFRFLEAPKNPSLVGRMAKVIDDFQGSSSAARTINAFMDIDSGIDNA